MRRSTGESAVLTIRVPADLERRLAREARRRRQTRGQVAKAILQERLGDSDEADAAAEARRQSLLVKSRRSERDALSFVIRAADLRGWK